MARTMVILWIIVGLAIAVYLFLPGATREPGVPYPVPCAVEEHPSIGFGTNEIPLVFTQLSCNQTATDYPDAGKYSHGFTREREWRVTYEREAALLRKRSYGNLYYDLYYTFTLENGKNPSTLMNVIKEKTCAYAETYQLTASIQNCQNAPATITKIVIGGRQAPGGGSNVSFE